MRDGLDEMARGDQEDRDHKAVPGTQKLKYGSNSSFSVFKPPKCFIGLLLSWLGCRKSLLVATEILQSASEAIGTDYSGGT